MEEAGEVTVPDRPGACSKARSWLAFPSPSLWLKPLCGRLDRSTSRGVSAHLTVLYPFVAQERFSAAVIGKAAAPVPSVPGFDCRCASIGSSRDCVLLLAGVDGICVVLSNGFGDSNVWEYERWVKILP